MNAHRIILSKRINAASEIIFVSPHLDDAILSSGELISRLSKIIPVRVVTVFTNATSPPESDLALGYLKQCGYKNGSSLFSVRRREDRRAFGKVGITPTHLGFVDSTWRRNTTNPILISLLYKLNKSLPYRYPETYFPKRLHILDYMTFLSIKNAMKKLTNGRSRYLVFCPLAVGSHVDHILVRNLCADLYGKNVVYWVDYPYSKKSNASLKFISDNNLCRTEFERSKNDRLKKRLMIKTYKSQQNNIFGGKYEEIIPEAYYYSL